jgi:hypothetical protein
MEVPMYYSNGYGAMPVGMDGELVTRTKQTHPYSYDSYVVYRNGANEEANGGAYTDRIWEWDRKLSDELWEKHAGKRANPHDLSHVSPKVMEAFLRERFGHPDLTIVVMLDGCNISNGYPVGFVSWSTSNKLVPKL